MALVLSSAGIGDVELLTSMNKRLIEAEGSRNKMTRRELIVRMASMLKGNWKADLILDDLKVIGYVLYQFRNEESRAENSLVYIRQYFIEKEYRNRGFGKMAFNLIKNQRFGPHDTVVLDVLAKNLRAQAFWKSMGFEPYCITMQLVGSD